MKCFNCGVNLDDSSKYCPRCGMLFSKNEDIDLYCNRDDVKYLEYYYSDVERHVYFYNISLGFLFFSFLYAFYKKMYLEGVYSFLGFCLFIWLLLSGIELFISSLGFLAVPIIFGFMISFFIYFYFLFNFNKLYVSNVLYRIQKIINNNPGVSEEEIVKLCEIDSKPNIILPIIVGVLVLVFLISFLFFWF